MVLGSSFEIEFSSFEIYQNGNLSLFFLGWFIEFLVLASLFFELQMVDGGGGGTVGQW